MKAWRPRRKTPFTKFVVITMVLVKIPVFYIMVPCRLVDCLQASLLDSSSRYLQSVISQKTGIFKTFFFIIVINQLGAQNNQSSLNPCKGQPPIGVMIPEAV